MRIIGGEAGGRRRQAPEGRQTRPTAERVREAVFSTPGGDMSGDRVLDVFAGVGRYGIGGSQPRRGLRVHVRFV